MSQIVLNLSIPANLTISGAGVGVGVGGGEHSTQNNVIDILENIRKTLDEMNLKLSAHVSVTEERVLHTTPVLESKEDESDIDVAGAHAEEACDVEADEPDVEEEESQEEESQAEEEDAQEAEEPDVEEEEEAAEAQEPDVEEESQAEAEEDAKEAEEPNVEEEDVQAEAEEEEGLELEEFEYKGKAYYKDGDDYVYILDSNGELVEDPVGVWNNKKSIVQFYTT